MYKSILIFLFLLTISQISEAQMPTWSPVRIQMDSLAPASLTFFDSLHGYLGAYKNFNPDQPFTEHHAYYFETSDGGKSWKEVLDTMIINLGANPNQFNSPVVYANLNSRYIGGDRIAHTMDGGSSWSLTAQNIGHEFLPLQSFSPYNLLVYEDESGLLYSTNNGGQSYSKFFDTVYKQTLYNPIKDSNYTGFGDTSLLWGNHLSFDNSDRQNWTVAICRGSYAKALHPPTNPMGLQTFVSDTYGYKWKSFLTPIVGEDSLNRIGGTLQYIKGTQNLYYFTGFFGEGQLTGIWDTSIHMYKPIELSDAIFGYNWLYSTDYGKSWEFQKNYGDKRRAFEAVQQNEIWITARQSNSLKPYDPACDILRTTDNGLSWEKDSLTLTDDQKLDGRIMTFSDPRHGWIAATQGGLFSTRLYVFRYNAYEQKKNVVEHTVATEIGKKYMKIYPNPSSDEVHLQLLPNADIKKVEFYDLLGRKVNPLYSIATNIATVQVRDLIAGTYITRVSCIMDGWNGRFTLPLVVQH